MIGNRAQRLIGRTVVTAAIVGAMVLLILIYIRSGGNGTGAVALRTGTSSSGASASVPSGQSTSSEAAGSGSPPTPSGRHSEPSGASGEAGASSGSGSTAGTGSHVGTGAPPAKRASGGATGTYTGSVVQTPYGPVQVAIAEEGGQITEAKALQVPTEHPQSLYISEQVTPLLREEALQAQSAQINIVSGATYTSVGYAESLQKALSHVR